jgi:arylsulfatase A-like enzyme
MRLVSSVPAIALLGLLAGTWAVVLPRPSRTAPAPRVPQVQPNVLFIMSDQHNARALGCAGNPEVSTPNLDRLAAAGARFTQATAQTPQCCPSRYTIWTGRYPRSHGLLWNRVVEPLEERTIAEILGERGYATATIGKHHMRHHPSEHGFAHVVDREEYRTALSFRLGDQLPQDARRDPELELLMGGAGASRLPHALHQSAFWADEALRFIDEQAGAPWCLWLSFYGPHTPIEPAEPFASMYDPAALTLPGNFSYEWPHDLAMLARLVEEFSVLDEAQHRRLLALYYGLVTQIDADIGRVLAHLEELGLARDTIVVYTADHGGMMGEHATWRKTTLAYDATVRVPLLVRGPGVRAGTVHDELVGLVDLLPTLLHLLDVPVPDAVQGISFAPLLRGRPYAGRAAIVAEVGYPGQGAGPVSMVRDATFKYVEHANGGAGYRQLFDLVADPWERDNLVDDHRHVEHLRALEAALAAWRAETPAAPQRPRQARKPR